MQDIMLRLDNSLLASMQGQLQALTIASSNMEFKSGQLPFSVISMISCNSLPFELSGRELMSMIRESNVFDWEGSVLPWKVHFNFSMVVSVLLCSGQVSWLVTLMSSRGFCLSLSGSHILDAWRPLQPKRAILCLQSCAVIFTGASKAAHVSGENMLLIWQR